MSISRLKRCVVAVSSCRRLRARTLIGAVSLVTIACGLSGCADFIGSHPLQAPRSVDSYASQHSLIGEGGRWPDTGWVQQFGNVQLLNLTREALANNPDLATAQARVAGAQAQAEAAHAALLPSSVAAGSLTRGRASQDLNLQTPAGPIQQSSSWSNQITGLLGINYELDFWGKNRASLAQAVSQARATAAEAQQARLSLLVALTLTYNQLAQLYDNRDILAQLLQLDQHLEHLEQGRVRAGLDGELELLDAVRRSADSGTQLAQLDEQIVLTRYQLSALLGKGPDRGLAITRPRLATLPAFKLPDQLPAHLIGRRPDIVAARWRVEAAASAVDLAKARFYPDINLSAFAGYASFGLSDVGKSSISALGAGPAISLPIFDGGRLRANLKGQYAQYDAAVAAYNQTLNGALIEVANQIASIHSVDRQMSTQARSLSASQRTCNLIALRYKVGLVSENAMASTRLALLAAQQRSSDLDARRRVLQISLIKALGGGFDARDSELEIKDARK